MIEIKDLYKSYGDKVIYSGFNLTLEEGKITCLLGSSGSGKTTLLNVLAGITSFGGEVPALDCSYIFQSPALVPNLTVLGNLKLVCKDEGAINDMLSRVGLKDKTDSYPINLSGGEAQRVAIARAFLHKSDILLMDEPFSSLDLKIKKQIIELFFELWKEDGRTVLAVTHDPDEAAAVAQRILILKDGVIAEDFTPQTPVPRTLYEGGNLREKLIGLLIK